VIKAGLAQIRRLSHLSEPVLALCPTQRRLAAASGHNAVTTCRRLWHGRGLGPAADVARVEVAGIGDAELEHGGEQFVVEPFQDLLCSMRAVSG
jgi:hypothetical protein